MVNSSEFIERLNLLLTHYGLTASQFADQIQVQRSSISHLLSGRNKPSLDFVMKVVQTYPAVNLYWLLNGKGEFPSSPQNSDQHSYPSPKQKDPLAIQTVQKPTKTERKIEKIIIFYSDGSFEPFTPK